MNKQLVIAAVVGAIAGAALAMLVAALYFTESGMGL